MFWMFYAGDFLFFPAEKTETNCNAYSSHPKEWEAASVEMTTNAAPSFPK